MGEKRDEEKAEAMRRGQDILARLVGRPTVGAAPCARHYRLSGFASSGGCQDAGVIGGGVGTDSSGALGTLSLAAGNSATTTTTTMSASGGVGRAFSSSGDWSEGGVASGRSIGMASLAHDPAVALAAALSGREAADLAAEMLLRHSASPTSLVAKTTNSTDLDLASATSTTPTAAATAASAATGAGGSATYGTSSGAIIRRRTPRATSPRRREVSAGAGGYATHNGVASGVSGGGGGGTSRLASLASSDESLEPQDQSKDVLGREPETRRFLQVPLQSSPSAKGDASTDISQEVQDYFFSFPSFFLLCMTMLYLCSILRFIIFQFRNITPHHPRPPCFALLLGLVFLFLFPFRTPCGLRVIESL